MLVDTDVLIWNLRGNARAADRLDAMQGFLLSAATYMWSFESFGVRSFICLFSSDIVF